jgi:hypothetical protein
MGNPFFFLYPFTPLFPDGEGWGGGGTNEGETHPSVSSPIEGERGKTTTAVKDCLFYLTRLTLVRASVAHARQVKILPTIRIFEKGILFKSQGNDTLEWASYPFVVLYFFYGWDIRFFYATA